MASPDYDLAALTEQALLLQAHDRAREIVQAEQSLDASLQGPTLSREDIVDTLAKLGIERKYAETAVDQMYPDPQKIAKLENSVGQSKKSKYAAIDSKIAGFLSVVDEHLRASFPALRLQQRGILFTTPFDPAIFRLGDWGFFNFLCGIKYDESRWAPSLFVSDTRSPSEVYADIEVIHQWEKRFVDTNITLHNPFLLPFFTEVRRYHTNHVGHTRLHLNILCDY